MAWNDEVVPEKNHSDPDDVRGDLTAQFVTTTVSQFAIEPGLGCQFVTWITLQGDFNHTAPSPKCLY